EANGSEHLNHLYEQFVEPRFLGLIRLDYGQLDCLQAVTHQRLATRQNNGEGQSRDRTISGQWQMRLDRAEYEAALAERRYQEVDPSQRLVAATLERRWN